MNEESPIQYGTTPGLCETLQKENVALIASSPQTGQLLLFHVQENGRLHMLMRTVGRPTGLFYHQETLGAVCRNQIWLFTKAPKLNSTDPEIAASDWVCSPQKSFVTGNVSGHQMKVVSNNIVFVNTLFSCLATVDDRYSFKPVWKPPFITELMPEDRCHLNGFCVDAQGNARFATALGSTNEKVGWRANKVSGGVIIDITTNEIVADSICMPHSPILLADALLFAESGKGAIAAMDLNTKQYKTLATFPGFVRGMTVVKNLLIVCTSLIRESDDSAALPLFKSNEKIECAIYVLTIPDFKLQGAISFQKGITEFFDIVAIPGVKKPYLVGFHDDTVDKIVTVP